MNRKLLALTLGLFGLGASVFSAETVHLYVRSGKPPATAAKLALQMSTQAENRLLQTAREAGSGLATGKRQHKPFRLRVPSDNAAFNALCDNENVTWWQLQFVRKNSAGKLECYETITFLGVKAKIAPANNTRQRATKGFQEVVFTFQKVTVDDKVKVWTDDWLAPV